MKKWHIAWIVASILTASILSAGLTFRFMNDGPIESNPSRVIFESYAYTFNYSYNATSTNGEAPIPIFSEYSDFAYDWFIYGFEVRNYEDFNAFYWKITIHKNKFRASEYQHYFLFLSVINDSFICHGVTDEVSTGFSISFEGSNAIVLCLINNEVY